MFIQNCLSVALVMCLKCTVLVQKPVQTGKPIVQGIFRLFQFFVKHRKIKSSREATFVQSEIVKHHAEDQ